MVGVLANSKTIKGIPNKRLNRYPPPGEIGNIFQPHPLALNLIHYNTKERETLFDQMREVRSLAGPHCHGFQLNIAWPDPNVLTRLAAQSQQTIIVLQIGSRAFEMVDRSPKKLAEKIAQEYTELVDYILLDPSGGYGKPFDPRATQVYLETLTSKNIRGGLGVAGGLGPSTLNLLEPLVRGFPDLSIDAEGKLRNKEDRLDCELARNYVQSALALFR